MRKYIGYGRYRGARYSACDAAPPSNEDMFDVLSPTKIIPEIAALFQELGSIVHSIKNPCDREIFAQHLKGLESGVCPIFRDIQLQMAVQSLCDRGTESNLGVIKTIDSCLSAAILADLDVVDADAELAALNLLDRLIEQANRAGAANRPIAAFAFDTLRAAELAGVPGIPIIRQITRASHIIALEAVMSSKPFARGSSVPHAVLKILESSRGLLPHQTPRPDFDPPLLDLEFAKKALRLAQLEDWINAILDSRGMLWPCPAVDYSPKHAVPGEQIVLESSDWPGTSARIEFSSASGSTVSARMVRRSETLSAIVPETAISGPATVYFEAENSSGIPGFSFGSGMFPRPRRGRRFCLDFQGGLSGFRDLELHAPGDQRCWGPHDIVVITWIPSNLDEVVASIDGEIVATGEMDTNTLRIRAPDRNAFEIVEIVISASGPADPAPEPFSLTQTVEIRTMPSDRVDPTPPDELRARSGRPVNNFYSFESKMQVLPVFRPRTLFNIKTDIRQAEADGLKLGVKSTGGSFEDVVFAENSDSSSPGSSSAILDLTGMVFDLFRQPSILELKRDGEQFINDYEDFVERLAANVRITKEVFQTQIREESLLPVEARDPDTGLISSIDNPALRDFRGATAVEPSPVSERLVYIDAAMKVWDANKVLAKLGLALPTLGASGFQSLAGVVSTGTHGSTFRLPPIADFVRAIHIIGSGGTEWWLEPAGRYGITTTEHLSGRPVSGEERLRLGEGRTIDRPIVHDRRCCNFVADTELFNDALVSVGQSGAIVGYVLETIDAHVMRSHRVKHSWSTCRERIREFLSTGTTSDVPRLRNLLDSDELWFYAPTVSSYGTAWTDYRFLTRTTGNRRLVGRDEFFEGIEDIIHGIPVVLAGIDAFDRFADIVPTINSDFTDGNLADVDRIHETIVEQTLGTAPDGFDEVASDYALAGKGFTFEDWDYKSASMSDSGRDRLRFQRSATAHEFCIDALDVIDFVDDLLLFAHEARVEALFDIRESDGSRTVKAIVFNANLRFTRSSRATLAMQKWPLTAHVEIFTHPMLSSIGSLYAELERLSEKYGARPHWGQKHENHDYSSLYDLPRWRRSMVRLARRQGGPRHTFGSAFANRELSR